MAPKLRQRAILEALRELGGEATIQEIAAKAGLNTNGVSQSLGVMSGQVTYVSGQSGKARYRMIEDKSPKLF